MSSSQPIALPHSNRHPQLNVHDADNDCTMGSGSLNGDDFNPASYTRHYMGSPISWRFSSWSATDPASFEMASSLSSMLGTGGDFAKDYTCCGQYLPDLHALTEHVEEVHKKDDMNPANNNEPHADPGSSSSSYVFAPPTANGVPVDPDDMEFDPDPEAHVNTRVAVPFSPAHSNSRSMHQAVPAILTYLNHIQPSTSQQHPSPQRGFDADQAQGAPPARSPQQHPNSQAPSQATLQVQPPGGQAQEVPTAPNTIDSMMLSQQQRLDTQQQQFWTTQASFSSLDNLATHSTPSPSSGVPSPPDTPVTPLSSAWPSPRLLASAAPLVGNPSPLGLGTSQNQTQGTHPAIGRTIRHSPSLQHLRPQGQSLRRENSLQHLRAAREALSPIPSTGLTPSLANLNTNITPIASSITSSPNIDGPSADGQLPPGLGRKGSLGTSSARSAAPDPHARSRAALHRVGPYSYASAPPSPHPGHARSGWLGRMRADRETSPPDAIAEGGDVSSRSGSPAPGLTKEQRRDLKDSLRLAAQQQGDVMQGLIPITATTSTASELAGALDETRSSSSTSGTYALAAEYTAMASSVDMFSSASTPADSAAPSPPSTSAASSPATNHEYGSSPPPADCLLISPLLSTAFVPSATPSGAQTPAAGIHSPPLSATPSPNASHAPSPVPTPHLRGLTRHASLGALGFARVGSASHIKSSLEGAVAEVYGSGYAGLSAASDYTANLNRRTASAEYSTPGSSPSTHAGAMYTPDGDLYSPTHSAFFGSSEPRFSDISISSSENSFGYSDSNSSSSHRTPVSNKTADPATIFSPPTYPQQLNTTFSTLGGALGTDPGGPGLTTGLARYGAGAGPSYGGIGMRNGDVLGWDAPGYGVQGMGLHGIQSKQPEVAPTCVQPAMLFSPSVTPDRSREASPSDPSDATREARGGHVGKAPRVKPSRANRDRKAEKDAKREKKRTVKDLDMTAAMVANAIPGAAEIAAAGADLRRARAREGDDAVLGGEAAPAVPLTELPQAAPVAGPSTASVTQSDAIAPPSTPTTGVPSLALPGTLPAHAAAALVLGKPLLSKPFRCPNPGCSKSYKQANGLKYHQQHGQCSFMQAKDVEIRDKLLEARAGGLAGLEGFSLPGTRPGTPGAPMTEADMQALMAGLGPISEAELRELEKEAERALRPFACTVDDCQRRYKNMNGLRYHYQHTGDHGAVGLALLATGQHPCLQNRAGSRAAAAAAAAAEDLKKDRKSTVISAAGTGGATASRTGTPRPQPRVAPNASVSVPTATAVSGRQAVPIVPSGMVGYAGQHAHASVLPQAQQKIYATSAAYGAQPVVPSPLGYATRAQEFSVPHSASSAVASAGASSSAAAAPPTPGVSAEQSQSASPSAIGATAQQQQEYAQMAYHAQYEVQRQQYHRQYQQQQQQLALAQQQAQQQQQVQAHSQAQQHAHPTTGVPGYREPDGQ